MLYIDSIGILINCLLNRFSFSGKITTVFVLSEIHFKTLKILFLKENHLDVPRIVLFRVFTSFKMMMTKFAG